MGSSHGFSPRIKTTSPSQHLYLLTTKFSLSKYCFLFTLGPCSSFRHGPSLSESLTKAGFWVRGKQNHGESTKIFQLQQLCSDAGDFNTNPLSFHTWYLIEIQRSCRARQLPRALQRGRIDREHIFNRLRSLTHLLSNINPSVITVGNSSLLSVCGSCSTQNHTFLRIWKIAASCLQLFSFLRAALSKRHPPTPWPPPFPAGIGTEHHTRTRAVPVRSSQPGRIACQHGRADPDNAVPLLLPSWLHSEQVTSPDQRTSLHPWSHLRERQAVGAGTASHYRYSLMSL